MQATSESFDVQALLSGQGQDIPLFKVFMSEETIQAAGETLRSGYIGQGPRVELFENKLKSYLSSPHVLTLNSGTSALQLALRLAGVGHGDEVITTPMTCMATNVPILATGADIVWADIDPMTGNISAGDVRQKITSRTRAIICVDWAGYPCDLEELQQIARLHNIKLIEDAAHGFGSTYRGRFVGGLVDFTCFSFQAIKHLTTVDGGALVCKSEDDHRRGKLLRWYGIDRESPRRDFRCEEDVVEYGYKFHMNDVNATIGIHQLNSIDAILNAHRENALFYSQAFKAAAPSGLELLDYKTDRMGSYWLYTMKVKNRAAFMEKMKERKITVSQVHARNDHHTVFKRFRTLLPGVDEFVQAQVSIPVGWWLTPQQRAYIAASVKELSEC